jgi:hypothetical protein
MNAHDLYVLAKQQNIEVIETNLPENGSLSIMDDSGNCYIGIDKSVMDGGALEIVHMADELGHCLTGSFYNRHTRFDVRQRHENRADKWAIRQTISVDDLDTAIASGYTEIWQLAEYFSVTEQFMRKAICLYVHGNVAADLYF